ncbi:Cupin domain-containing protein [Desulfitobacterium sp. LBE]|uniref:cupin domain-containing protein n=1 Tax=Desulfitobacterium sp. LBE TaxID=884086 RepID=UPI001199DE00|nr:cupin domain-containing protein [Desulfitobacterium sp. LBE]TWH60307.1 Cupin domain-containing protein [Desulfitobacterium sp. LBE]
MTEKLIKNIEHSAPFKLLDLVAYEPGKVASLTLAQKPGVGLTILAFAEGEGVSTHAAHGDAMAYIMDGEAEITIAETRYRLKAGEGIVMPAGIPHAVQSITSFKMLLTVVKNS